MFPRLKELLLKIALIVQRVIDCSELMSFPIGSKSVSFVGVFVGGWNVNIFAISWVACMFSVFKASLVCVV